MQQATEPAVTAVTLTNAAPPVAHHRPLWSRSTTYSPQSTPSRSRVKQLGFGALSPDVRARAVSAYKAHEAVNPTLVVKGVRRVDVLVETARGEEEKRRTSPALDDHQARDQASEQPIQSTHAVVT
ncbi:hypothetical protein FA95DRAFT_1601314 [Auriscalpium vulgare]|uniref:Uncharacterized protein n=1 Tax=Auriscalpium vulgare TaxID=40419 RepID=A0ACB8S8Y2_9AGAM|nr:hypothetical protein FA95DRAFT_1601314 [Auriscalpium vulgare]